MTEEKKQAKYRNDICDLLNIDDASEKDICLIIWKLVAKELRIDPDQLDPDTTTDEVGRMVYPPFVGLDILGELEHEIKMSFHRDIHFDDSKVPAFATPGLFRFRRSKKPERLRDWILKITKLTNALIKEANSTGKKG